MDHCLNIIIIIIVMPIVIIVLLTILTMIMIIQIMIIVIMVILNTQLWGEQRADSEALRQPGSPLSDNAKVIMIMIMIIINIINIMLYHHDRLHHHLHHRYQEAEKMHLKAIQIKESLLGLEDYEVAFSYKTSTPSCSFID